MLRQLSLDDDNCWTMIYTLRYITMLWPLSWDKDNWRSMFHTWTIYHHALSVVMRRWQLTSYGSYLRGVLPWYVPCQKTVITDGACFIHEWYISMLWPLSWDDDNWRSMIHTLGIYYHALTIVIRRWQLTEHVSYLRDGLHALSVVNRRWLLNEYVPYMNDLYSCSDRCH